MDIVYTLQQALDNYINELYEVPGLQQRYINNKYSDKSCYYCSSCGWYYPHGDQKISKCYRCGREAIWVDNSNDLSCYKMGLFG